MIEVRLAVTAADQAECLRIRAEVFIAEQHVPAAIERDAHDADALHFLATQDGMAVGTARVVLKDQGETAKIGRVAVRKTARGAGIGQQLMAGIEDCAELGSVAQFALEAQVHALGFYERLGYAAYGEIFMEAGIPHRAMRKARP